MRNISPAFLCILLASCMTNPRVDDLTPAQRSKISAIQIYNSTPDRPHTVLATVSGLSCNRNAQQVQDISDEEAIQGIKIKAAALEANAVINLFCQKNSDTDWRNNCWASVKCIGEAIRFEG